jgi:hypothetical protein
VLLVAAQQFSKDEDTKVFQVAEARWFRAILNYNKGGQSTLAEEKAID